MALTVAQEEFQAVVGQTSHTRYPSDSYPPSSNSSPGSTPRSSSTSPIVSSAGYQIPSTHFDANTGPKGVIADAQSYERARKRTFRQTLNGISNVLSNNVLSVSEKMSSSSRRRGSDKSSSSDEDEFMASWREKRMQELQAQGSEVRTRRISPSKRSWGKVVNVDPMGYLDAIEKVSDDTVVVVMIHDDESALSGIVEDALSNLARRWAYTRFVKLSYLDAEMDPAGVPAILAYKAGNLIANLVSVVDEIPSGRDMSTSSLEYVLKRNEVLT